MLLKCPSCGGKIRAPETTTREKFSFLCQECQQIVHLNPDTDEIDTTSSPARLPSASSTIRILIVDDNLTFLEMVRDMLVKEGFEVLVAHDGTESLKKITEEHPNLVFLDLFMPGMTGFEVLKTLRTSPAYRGVQDIPVLVTSGAYHPAEFEILNDGLGAAGYINKEVVADELVFRIKKMLHAEDTDDHL